MRVGPVPTEVGQRVRCLWADGYNFTEGREYSVTGYQPAQQMHGAGGFTFPAYVHVIDDTGITVICHASRFEVIQ